MKTSFINKLDIKALFWIMGVGIMAGSLFNLALGAALWNVGGLLGGAVSGLLVYLTS